MAPTICVAEFPMATGTTVSSRVRYRRGSQSGMKRRRFALEEMLRTGTIVETLLLPHDNCELRRLDYANTISDCSVVDRSAEYATNTVEDYKRLVAERKDLLSIVVRTIILVRRNRILQRRLNALRAETRRFLRSVLNNPENQQRRSPVPSYLEDSSSTEKIVSTLSSLLPADSTKNSFQITSQDYRDHTNNESRSFDKSEANRSEC